MLTLISLTEPLNAVPPLRRFLFYREYLLWLGKYTGIRDMAVVIFDHLHPEIAEYIPHHEFREWYDSQGYGEIVITSKTNNSWRGFGVKEVGANTAPIATEPTTNLRKAG